MVDYRSVGGAINYASTNSLKDIVSNGFGGILFSVGASIIAGVIEISELVTRPLDAFGTVLLTAVESFFLIPLTILETAGVTSRESLTVGGSFDVGPFTLFLGLLIVIGAYLLISTYLSEDETSNVIPGAPFDIDVPGFRNEESDE